MRFELGQFGRLRTRLLVLVLLVLFPALGLVWYGNTEQQRMERRSVRQNALATAKLAAASQEYFAKHSQHLLATLTQFPFLTMATDRPFCEWHLANLKLLQPEYADFGLIETNGTLFCSALKTNTPVEFLDDSMFQRVMLNNRFALGNLEPDPVAAVPTLRFGYPVHDTNGVMVRVLYASLHLPLLSEALAELPLPENGSVMVLDRNGTVVARHPEPEKWVGRQLGVEPYIQNGNGGKTGDVLWSRDGRCIPIGSCQSDQ